MDATDPSDEPDASRTSVTLTARVRSGHMDQEAWSRVVYLYGPLIRVWAARKGVNGADADDLVQDVFHEVSRSLDGFRKDRPGDSFRGWLRGVTRNVLLRRFERQVRHFPAAGGTAALEGLNALPEEVEGDEPDPSGELNALYRRGLDLVRSEFEARTWRAFWEHVVDGRSPAEVAADLGVSPAAVRRAKSRVLRRLREELGDLVD